MLAVVYTRLILLSVATVPSYTFTIRHSITDTGSGSNNVRDVKQGSLFKLSQYGDDVNENLGHGRFASAVRSDENGPGYLNMRPDTSTNGSGGSGGRGMNGPFSAAMSVQSGSTGGSQATGGNADGSPFSTAANGGIASGNGPFIAASTLGKGVDISSLMTSLGAGYASGYQGSASTINTARFNTANYENMLKDMFKPGSVGDELTRLGNPFDGTSYNLPTNHHADNEHHYDTSKEASVGSYASTDMTYNAWSSGGANDDSTSHQQHQASSGHDGSSVRYSTHSTDRDQGSTSSGYNSPFDVRNYDTSKLSMPLASNPYTNNKANNANQNSSPFDVLSSAKNSFSVNNNGMNSGHSNSMENNFSGNGPFTTNTNFMGNGPGNTAAGRGPFDVSQGSFMGNSGGQSPFNVNSMSGNGQSPFNANTNYNKRPFNVNKNSYDQSPYNVRSQSSSGQGPFSIGLTGSSTSGSLHQSNNNMDIGTLNHGSTDHLYQYGNIDFENLPGPLGESGKSTSDLDSPRYTMQTTAYTGGNTGSYTGSTRTYTGGQTSTTNMHTVNNEERATTSSHNNEYSAGYSHGGLGSSDNSARLYPDYSTSGGYTAGNLDSQYQTPFESDNYNDLLGNPFQSENYFDNNKQNFKTPYEDRESASLRSGQPKYTYSGQSDSRGGYSVGAGPGGNPYQQAGHSLGPNNVIRE